ncbi:MAG TPA: membrane protein insertion efficiency factor YidD [Candidatus Acidoferrales bacterium]|nr:membrane protein insertion efficiency factor YidD [Candidatus Acidoferrales bacterium]
MKQAISRGLQRALIGMVRCYRFAVSPYLTPRCRYTPTCSAYALESLERHGSWRGSGYALRRLLRCHPWGGSGFDPVPDAPKREQTGDEA